MRAPDGVEPTQGSSNNSEEAKNRKVIEMRSPTFIRPGLILALCATAGLSVAQTPLPTPQRHPNGPPLVRLLTPGDGEIFLLGHTIPLTALSQNFTDMVARVEFYAGAKVLGAVTNRPFALGGFLSEPLYSFFAWSNAPTGPHVLTAVATDRAGNSVTSAPVDISVVADLPPVVSLVKPQTGATILEPTNVTLVAFAYDPDGTVSNVEFFEGTSSLGVVTNPVLWVTNRGVAVPIRQSTYSLTWSNVPAGAYSLTALATDNGGVSTTSAVVKIAVVTDLPPVVKIASPEAGARYFAPANIKMYAAAKDPDGKVTAVEFFAGTTSLGVETNGLTVTNDDWQVQKLYGLTWSNVLLGTYSLTAVATDNGGVSSTSAPVQVTVVTRPAPAVQIVYPSDGAKFWANANIYIATSTRYFTNPIAAVQFFAGTKSLGVVTNSSWPTFHWASVPPGAYVLTAVATDTRGVNATSPPVNITVLTNLPPRPFWSP